MAADVRLTANAVHLEGTTKVIGNAFLVGEPKAQFKVQSGGQKARVVVGGPEKAGDLRVQGQDAFVHVSGIIRATRVDAATLRIGRMDVAARLADLERRIAALGG